MTHEVVRTRGGALAMRSIEDGEVMHPGVGPLVEAETLYVRQLRLAERLREHDSKSLVLFDVGLGAGSNALCARAVSERAAGDAAVLELVSFERDLGALELALLHGEAFGFDGDAAAAARALIDSGRHDTARTHWRLRHGELLALLAVEEARADLVFWDPFSPRTNPELWTVAAFRALRRTASSRCTLATYSASTATRVSLLLAGFAVGVGDPIGEKRQTTTAAVDINDLARPLDKTFIARIARADAPMPTDAPADARERIAALPQFA